MRKENEKEIGNEKTKSCVICRILKKKCFKEDLSVDDINHELIYCNIFRR